jgi:hypothetical protein
MGTSLYETDYYGWTQEQARLLGECKFDLLDIQHLMEEIADMGGSVLNSFINHLAIAAAHLMKWQYQPERRGSSWQITIKAQRELAQDILAENPSFKGKLEQIKRKVDRNAMSIAARDMGDYADRLPAECPYTIEQILDNDFWPV